MNDYQQKTLAAFDGLEKQSEDKSRLLDPPRDYLRTLGNRLVYLYKKQPTIHRRNGVPTFIDDEINATLWILAEYAVAKPYDVIARLKLVSESKYINFGRLQSIIDHLTRRKENANGPEQNQTTRTD